MTQTLILTITAFFSGMTGASMYQTPQHATVKETEPPAKILNSDKEEILWLARVIFSETKNKDEMNLVGWVVRNRVEKEYRGSTYKEVALSNSQFSGLGPDDEQYHININMGYDSVNEKWLQALGVATTIYFADDTKRPFSNDVLHFYSPISVRKTPDWTKDGNLDYTATGTSEVVPRFAFYSGVK